MAKGYAAYIIDEYRKLEKELLNDAYKINRKIDVDIEDEMLFDDRKTQREKHQISSEDEIFKDERKINNYHSSKRGLFDFFEKIQKFVYDDYKEGIIDNPVCDIQSEESQKKDSSIEDNTVTGLMMRIQRLGSAAFIDNEESLFKEKKNS